MSQDRITTVACVLKQGGVYDFNYVKILSLAVRRRLLRSFQFVCLTDAPPPHPDWLRGHRITLRPLIHGWPGAWAKIELFRPGLFDGRVIYIDLAVLATGSLARLADYDGPFAVLSDFHRPAHLDASVMIWRAGMPAFIYRHFIEDPARVMSECAGPSDWIDICCRRESVTPDRIDALMPNLCAPATPILAGAPVRTKPKGAGLVCFTGRAKPHALIDDYDFVRAYWV